MSVDLGLIDYSQSDELYVYEMAKGMVVFYTFKA